MSFTQTGFAGSGLFSHLYMESSVIFDEPTELCVHTIMNYNKSILFTLLL